MRLVIDLADRAAIRDTYSNCQKWRAKGGVLRQSVGPNFKPFDPTQLLAKRRWHTLLELGCGLEKWMTGMVEAAAPDATIYAYDISPDILRVFSKEYIAAFPSQRPSHHCVIGDGEHLKFPDNYFDGISAVFVGHHMSDAEGFVSGLARVLKSDGWLLTNSLDWSFPPPDFPSKALKRLLGKPARFVVLNAFDESKARKALRQHFREVREHRVTLPAELSQVERVMKLHSRLEEFIKQILPAEHTWSDYLSTVEELVREHFARHRSYQFELPITYFLAEHPRRDRGLVKSM